MYASLLTQAGTSLKSEVVFLLISKLGPTARLLLPSSKYLTKSSSKMIAVSVHEMISVPSELLAKLLQDLLYLVLREVCVSKVKTLFVFKLLPELSRLPGTG